MATTILLKTGDKITPGKCPDCGYDNDWDVDDYDNIHCGCTKCPSCGERWWAHKADCCIGHVIKDTLEG